MALAIHNYFTFFSSGDLYDSYLNFSNPGEILSFQGGAYSPDYHNGINYVQIDDDPDVNYEYNFIMWDAPKLVSPHPLTLTDPDPTRGNRLVGSPIMVQRVSPDTGVDECIFRVGDITATEVSFVSYTSGTKTVVLRLRTNSTLDIVGESCNIASEVPINPDTESLTTESGTYPVSTEVEDWTGVISAFDQSLLTIVIDNPPSTISKLNDVKWMSLGKQDIYILPLDYVKSNIDQFPDTPSVSMQSWTYADPATYMIGPYRTITPRVALQFPSVLDKFKCLVVTERDDGLGQYNNGFKLMPIAII